MKPASHVCLFALRIHLPWPNELFPLTVIVASSKITCWSTHKRLFSTIWEESSGQNERNDRELYSWPCNILCSLISSPTFSDWHSPLLLSRRVSLCFKMSFCTTLTKFCSERSFLPPLPISIASWALSVVLLGFYGFRGLGVCFDSQFDSDKLNDNVHGNDKDNSIYNDTDSSDYSDNYINIFIRTVRGIVMQIASNLCLEGYFQLYYFVEFHIKV